MKPKITLFLLLCCFACALTNAQGKLNRAKEDLSSTNSSSSSSSSRSSDQDYYDNAGYFDGVFIELAYYISYGVLFGDMESRYFYKYPYAEGSHGEYSFPEENVPSKRSQLIISNTFFASGKEFYGNNTSLNFRFLPLLGIEANHLHFFEQNPKEELSVNSIMINYYRVREQYVTAYWGVGITHVGSGVDDTGFAYQVGLDVYLKKPYSLGISWKQSLINDSTVDELKLLVRRHLKRVSIHGGYHHYKLGSVTINAAGVGLDYRF
ncbi:hypothetical protein [Kordia jejudonensis]|uniref:hypothetical protein n=1 Tax=Kordia jejudonensis TaxID=1348245 RepID=UPI00062939FC|nr:hypothetical protein [Kordia jejudonensis]